MKSIQYLTANMVALLVAIKCYEHGMILGWAVFVLLSLSYGVSAMYHLHKGD